MQAFLAVILMFVFQKAAAENYLVLRCAHDAIDNVSIEKRTRSDTYLLQAECSETVLTNPVEIQSTDFNYPSLDERIVLSCQEGSCFKETIPLEDIVLWHNRTDRTCEGEEDTSNLLPVLSKLVTYFYRVTIHVVPNLPLTS